MKKMLFYILIISSIFIIFKTNNNKINYFNIGDSLSSGINSYNQLDYSYSLYLRDYLKKNNKLNKYINHFSSKYLCFNDVFNDLQNNNQIIVNNHRINIRKELRESNLVVISIGQETINEYLNKNIKLTKEGIINYDEFDKMIKEIKKYAKGRIIVIGYFNSNPYDYVNFDSNNKSIKIFNKRIKDICINNKVDFIDVFVDLLKTEYFPNPNSRYINLEGQKVIFMKILKTIEI